MLKKIVVIGPESTGKSTLCEQLAEHYNTLWCPEFAREWLLINGKKYGYDDLLTIAKGQVALEDEYISMINRPPNSPLAVTLSPGLVEGSMGHSLLFIDTDMYVMKVWCEFVFEKCHRFILDQIVERKYDLYLLCDTDLPWVKDELREYPDLESRRKLYHIYEDILINQTVPWVHVKGNEQERLGIALAGVNKIVQDHEEH